MSVKRIPTNDLIPGMVAGEDIYTFNNKLIIRKDAPISDHVITRLKFYSIPDIPVFIEDVSHEAPVPPVDPSVPYRERVKQTEEFKMFHRDYLSSVHRLSTTLNQIATTHFSINPNDLLSQVSTVLGQVRNSTHLFDVLHCLRDSDDITFTHSLNVALICNAMAGWLGLSQSDTDALTTAALLHDIGKLFIPRNILQKTTPLSAPEYAIIRTHSQLGYTKLKEYESLDNRIKRAVLMHHERWDGSGYPVGLTGPYIDDFAKIIAIADVYDAMSSKRIYRNEICPFHIVRQFEEEGFQLFDPEYILVFLHHIVDTYLHNNVLLTNGTEGEIVLINQNCLSRPVVQAGNSFIDLSHRRDLDIERII